MNKESREGLQEPQDQQSALKKEHEDSKKATLETLEHVQKSLTEAEQTIHDARIRLAEATRKYQERFYGGHP